MFIIQVRFIYYHEINLHLDDKYIAKSTMTLAKIVLCVYLYKQLMGGKFSSNIEYTVEYIVKSFCVITALILFVSQFICLCVTIPLFCHLSRQGLGYK